MRWSSSGAADYGAQHLSKEESIHVLEGACASFFDDAGRRQTPLIGGGASPVAARSRV